MSSVYVGTSLHNVSRAKSIITRFRSNNIEISYDWTVHGQVFDVDDLTYIAEAEICGVKNCDLFFMIQPGRSGTHCELGIAIGLNKPIIILGDCGVFEKKSFYYAKGVEHFSDEDAAVNAALIKLNNI